MAEEKNEPDTTNETETKLPTDKNQYRIGGITYNVTSSFRGLIDLRKTVYEHAMERVLEEMKKEVK